MVLELNMWQENIRTFSAIKEEPAWFLEERLKALELSQKLDLPVIDRVKFHRWNLFSPAIGMGDSLILDIPTQIRTDIGAAKIVQLGSVSYWEEMKAEVAAKGVIVTEFFNALEEYPELVKEHFMTKAVKMDEDSLAAYHRAMMNSGIFVYVPKNVVLDEPIESHFVQNSTIEEAFVKHVLIVAEENSSFEYIERFESVGEVKNTANIIVEVIAKAGAQVRYTAVDSLGKSTDTYFNRRGYLGRDAKIEWALGVMNDGNVVADFDSELIGTGSHSEVKVVAISTGNQVQGIDTRVTNYAKHSVGHILQHGVILDKATLTFNGIGHIIKGAKFADAQQESRVLMLSEDGRGDANPILLIDENEVTAGHAASVGQVDKDQMFYLTSRGLSEDDAQRLVIRGFLGSVIAAISVESVRKTLIDMIEKKLGE
nr:Fe-S cluster assembly protein SufD [Granulicatella balaenopterae]